MRAGGGRPVYRPLIVPATGTSARIVVDSLSGAGVALTVIGGAGFVAGTALTVISMGSTSLYSSSLSTLFTAGLVASLLGTLTLGIGVTVLIVAGRTRVVEAGARGRRLPWMPTLAVLPDFGHGGAHALAGFSFF